MFHLETERLVLKHHSLADLQLFNKWENDPDQLYFNDEAPQPRLPETLEETRRYLERISQKDDPSNSILYFGIYLKPDVQPELDESQRFIGRGMIAFIDHFNKHCKLGILIGEHCNWGKGYASEALSAILHYCFNSMEMNRIGVEIFAFNQRSCRLFEGLGFKQEGTIRQNIYKNGEFHDELLYGILRSEWESHKG